MCQPVLAARESDRGDYARRGHAARAGRLIDPPAIHANAPRDFWERRTSSRCRPKTPRDRAGGRAGDPGTFELKARRRGAKAIAETAPASRRTRTLPER